MRFRALTFTCTMTLVGAGALDGPCRSESRARGHRSRLRVEDVPLAVLPQGHGTLEGVPHAATEAPHVDVYSGKGKSSPRRRTSRTPTAPARRRPPCARRRHRREAGAAR